MTGLEPLGARDADMTSVMGNATGGASRFVGQRVKRREDPRLLAGRGRYADDVSLPGQLHVGFVRSDVPAGRIRRIDTEGARALPGVCAVFTGAELNPICGPLRGGASGLPQDGPGYPVLAEVDVRFVGEPIAAVVAQSRYIAEDACELVEVDVEPMAAVATLEAAMAEGAPIVHPEVGTNVVESSPVADAELEEILARAPQVITRTFGMTRTTDVPMEGRGVVASWNQQAGELTVWPSTQSPHGFRIFAARVLGIPSNRVRVEFGDVGGGFGQKINPSREEAAVLLAAKLLGQPVKWTEDRRENLIAANQARHDVATVTMAVDHDGHILATTLHLLEGVGSYPSSGGVVLVLIAMMFCGPYRMRSVGFSSQTVFTNTCGKGAFRGPWAIETIAREQMMDAVARELGLDPLEFRRRNVIHHAELPYSTPSGAVYDVVTSEETMEQAVEMFGWDDFRAKQGAAAAEGRLLGAGLSVCVEPSAVALGAYATEAAVVRMDASGQIEVMLGTGSHGQSLETTIPQVVADHLGCDIDDVVLRQGSETPFGAGTGGSRSAVIAGGAAQSAATTLREKIVALAAHLLEAAPEDLEVVHSVVSVRGTPARSVSFVELAAAAYLNPTGLPPGIDPGLEATSRFQPPASFTWSNACHLCECEIDSETGVVTLRRYLVSEDCGVMINPMVVEGQIAGGVAQGIGGVLYEEMAYDDEANPLATTFMDYLLPTANEVPELECSHIETPSPSLGGYKGMGEGGAIASPAAVANAINDALASVGAPPVTQFPITPARVLESLDHAR
jgi:carbon-monoxide dehydrogenase large subunit